MQILSNTKILNVLSGLVIISGLTACATPKPYAPLENLKTDYEAIQKDDAKISLAPVTFYEVEGAIKKAELAAAQKDNKQLEHQTYLGQKTLEIALAKVQQKTFEARTKTLSEQRNALLIEARTKESQVFKAEVEATRKSLEESNQEFLRLKKEAEAAKSSLEAYKSKETSRGTVLVLDDLLFDTGGANLHMGSQKNLRPLIDYLQKSPERHVSIEGHTDSIGDDNFNKTLSLRRAESVRDYLSRSGIDEKRMVVKGFGELYPVASNTTREGRQLNRRVEVLIKN